jgi:hypothetical protein
MRIQWVTLANSSDLWIVLETMKYLTDRAYGKARQTVKTSGIGAGPLVVISSV